MALGLALLFGFVLPQNFDAPYRAVSLQDFWRRWHMTLSRFLRDYLYIPFGGSRAGLPGSFSPCVAHHDARRALARGGAHLRRLGPRPRPGALRGRALETGRLAACLSALGIALTFAFVALAWVLFRAPTFGAAMAIYGALLGFAPLGGGVPWPMLGVAAAVATLGPTAWDAVHRVPPTRWAAVAGAVVFALVLLRVGDDANYEFLYVQF